MNISIARNCLGQTALSLSDSQIQDIISMFEYVAESFLDEHEKELFNGNTLKQLLQKE